MITAVQRSELHYLYHWNEDTSLSCSENSRWVPIYLYSTWLAIESTDSWDKHEREFEAVATT